MRALSDIILKIIIAYISIAMYNISYAKINNYKIKINFKFVLITFIVTLLNLINSNFNPLEIKVIFNTFLLCLELKILFKENWKKIIINYIFICLILFIIETFITNLLLKIGMLHNNLSANTISYINLLLTFLVQVIECIVISIKYLRMYIQKVINYFNGNNTLINMLYLLFITIVILSIFNVENFSNSYSITLIMLLTIIFTFLFIAVIRLKYHEEILKISNKKLIDYNDNYGKFLDDYKIYKHNINHKLSAMKAFGNKKINALIDDLLEEETTFTIKNNELYKIPNGIKGIVTGKLYNKDYNVIIDNKIKKDPFIKLDAKSFNSISECIGIALDNAIEASEETEDPIILIDLKEDKENIYLKIGNNYCNGIDLDNIGNKYYSTKNRGSGLGLFSIKQNNLVKEQIEIINDFYYIKLQIKKTR